MQGFYVSLSTCDMAVLKRICGMNHIKGIVIGDFFCEKRMFFNGITDEILFMNYILLNSNKILIYQTPLYVTSRNWEKISSIIRLLSMYSEKCKILVQDMGVTKKIREMSSDIEIIWSEMGRGRTYHFSRCLLLEMYRNGITGFVTGAPDLIKMLQEINMKIYIPYGEYKYLTVGRICYTKYQLGKCDRELCLSKEYSLSDKDGDYQMTIDGYVLGEKYLYHCAAFEENEVLCKQADMIVAGKNIGIIERKIKELEERIF